MAKRKPTEFAINMNLEKLMLLQQSDLKYVSDYNYFDDNSPCHIYFIGKRPRICIDPENFKVDSKELEFHFKIQIKNEFKNKIVRARNDLGTSNVRIVSEYPFSTFNLYDSDELLTYAKSAIIYQQFARDDREYLDFEVLYIGQSYGVEGSRTAPDRLKSHSTLQGIYSEAIANNPDSEIWLALASFEQINIMMMDGRTPYSQQELEDDRVSAKNTFGKLNYDGINEQQKINFTEAALIRYFQPRYNKIYMNTFPNPAHETYKECYDLDINSVCIELQTMEIADIKFFSDHVPRGLWHMHNFLLHSPDERKSIFEIVY